MRRLIRASLGMPSGRRPGARVGITSWRWSPRCACAPWRGGGGGLHVHHGSSYGRESRACACGSCCAVGRCACSRGRPRLYGGGSILDVADEVKPTSMVIRPEPEPEPRPKAGARVRIFKKRRFRARARARARARLRERLLRNSSSEIRSRLAGDFALRSENGICYQASDFVSVEWPDGGVPREVQETLWITSGSTAVLRVARVSLIK